MHFLLWSASQQYQTLHCGPKTYPFYFLNTLSKRSAMPLGTEVDLCQGDVVLDGDPAPPPKKGAQFPIFGPCLLWPDGWMHQDTTWYGGRPRPRWHCVRWGPRSPWKVHSPQLSAHDYCGQTAERIKMPLGTEVDLVPGHIVLDGDLASPERGTAPPLFSAHVYCDHTVAHLSYCWALVRIY